MYAMAREAGFDPDTRVKEVVTAYGYAHDGDVVRGKEDGFYEQICIAIQDKTWKAPTAAQAAPGEAKKQELTPVKVEGVVDAVSQSVGKDKLPVLILHMVDKTEVHCFEENAFPLLSKSQGLACVFNCGKKEGVEGKVKLLGILRVGDKEWLSDGTPVIQVDRGEAPAGGARRESNRILRF